MGLLRTRRGLSLLGFATVLAVACVLLGLWQLDRYQQRGERNDMVREALTAAPVPLDQLVPAGASADDVAPQSEWRSAVVRGSYDADAEVLLRLRPVEGASGVHALTPMRLDDGRTVLVDRGFLATTSRTTQDAAVPPAAARSVELIGRVRLSESGRRAGLDVDTDPPSIRFVDLSDDQAFGQGDMVPVWLERVEQVPAEDATLLAVPPPRLSSGTSLIYAVQWFLFGVIAVVGFVVLARRESPGVHEPPSAEPRGEQTASP